MELIINNTSYSLIAAVPTGMGAEFDFRNAYLLTLEMDWQTAHEIFVDGLEWALSVNGEISDKHDFTKAGQIIDYRNGTISAFMGEKTEAEKLEAENERILPIIQDLLPYLDDELAQQMLDYFPAFTAGTAYELGDRIQYNNMLYRCITAHTADAIWNPEDAPSMWAPLLTIEGVIAEWIQPDSTNPYMTGDKVTHNGNTWVCNVDNNVWEPGIYGWTTEV